MLPSLDNSIQSTLLGPLDLITEPEPAIKTLRFYRNEGDGNAQYMSAEIRKCVFVNVYLVYLSSSTVNKHEKC